MARSATLKIAVTVIAFVSLTTLVVVSLVALNQSGDSELLAADQLQSAETSVEQTSLPSSQSSKPAVAEPELGAIVGESIEAETGFLKPGTNTSVKPVSFWVDKFSIDGLNSYCHPLADTADSWKYYGHAYCTDAFTAMYRVTGDKAYLDEALDQVKTIVSNARPSTELVGGFGDDYEGWIAESHPEEHANGKEQQLYEVYQWRYVSTLLRVMHDDEELMQDDAYRSDFEELFAFSERNIFDKWYSRGPNSYVYRVTPHIAAHMGLIATNFSAITDDPQRKQLYDEVADKINNGMPNYQTSLKQGFEPNPDVPGAYVWEGNFETHEIQDVSHGNAVIAFIVEAEGLEDGWVSSEIDPLIVTTKKVILKDTSSCPANVDGSGSGACWIYDGFAKLGRYDAELQRTLETMTDQHSHQFVAHAALNARFLGAAN